ncbi:MAG: hypothetical protein DMG05_21255 [Acidobacteria bacterium]|nr:MAG: hypothetical protein DMG05_21255 [Acidobacteriota bacterium]
MFEKEGGKKGAQKIGRIIMRCDGEEYKFKSKELNRPYGRRIQLSGTAKPLCLLPQGQHVLVSGL